ncbi:hypothetical protein QQF64_019432 [Cirrhinus molitorella]|uniref:Uncharacterized protein n=1 Tax=Cirrhinus molitorella TaxID=172907 RepID=A0ABR3LHW4_9TELE
MMAVGASKIVKASNAIDAENARKREIEELKQFTADIQEMVKKTVNLLTVISGRVTVMERQSVILWEPVKKAMEDVMKAAEIVAKHQLSSGLINTLRKNVGEMMALLN